MNGQFSNGTDIEVRTKSWDLEEYTVSTTARGWTRVQLGLVWGALQV
jgi:hypothetical protein